MAISSARDVGTRGWRWSVCPQDCHVCRAFTPEQIQQLAIPTYWDWKNKDKKTVSASPYPHSRGPFTSQCVGMGRGREGCKKVWDHPVGKKKRSDESLKASKRKPSSRPSTEDLKSLDDKWAECFARIEAMLLCPPVPKRLVGESHIPPNLSPVCTDLVALCQELGWLVNKEKSALDLKQVFKFVGYQFDLREGKVRPIPELCQALTDKIQLILSGPAVHIPHKSAYSNRKASPPRLAPHETHTVALEKQLEGPRTTRKGDTSSQVIPPSLKMVAGGKQCSTRSTITPTRACSHRKKGGALT